LATAAPTLAFAARSRQQLLYKGDLVSRRRSTRGETATGTVTSRHQTNGRYLYTVAWRGGGTSRVSSADVVVSKRSYVRPRHAAAVGQ